MSNTDTVSLQHTSSLDTAVAAAKQEYSRYVNRFKDVTPPRYKTYDHPGWKDLSERQKRGW